MTPPPDPAQQVLQVATGYIASTALYAALTLDVADHRAAGPRAEVVSRTFGSVVAQPFRLR